MEVISIGLGILSFIISIIAIIIAIKSDRKMKAIANLEYDEKLAIMASHSEKVKTEDNLASIERIKHDLSAVSNLRKYADRGKKEALIENYIIPILDRVLNRGDVSGERAVVIAEIIDIALEFNIATEGLKDLRKRLRGE